MKKVITESILLLADWEQPPIQQPEDCAANWADNWAESIRPKQHGAARITRSRKGQLSNVPNIQQQPQLAGREEEEGAVGGEEEGAVGGEEKGAIEEEEEEDYVEVLWEEEAEAAPEVAQPPPSIQPPPPQAPRGRGRPKISGEELRLRVEQILIGLK